MPQNIVYPELYRKQYVNKNFHRIINSHWGVQEKNTLNSSWRRCGGVYGDVLEKMTNDWNCLKVV